MFTNDNDPATRGATPPPSNAPGLAALLLVESLVHGLCERAVLSNEEAVNIVETAVDVQFDQAEEADGAGAPMLRSHALLSDIAASLRMNGEGAPTSPRLVQ